MQSNFIRVEIIDGSKLAWARHIYFINGFELESTVQLVKPAGLGLNKINGLGPVLAWVRREPGACPPLKTNLLTTDHEDLMENCSTEAWYQENGNDCYGSAIWVGLSYMECILACDCFGCKFGYSKQVTMLEVVQVNGASRLSRVPASRSCPACDAWFWGYDSRNALEIQPKVCLTWPDASWLNFSPIICNGRGPVAILGIRLCEIPLLPLAFLHYFIHSEWKRSAICWPRKGIRRCFN